MKATQGKANPNGQRDPRRSSSHELPSTSSTSSEMLSPLRYDHERRRAVAARSAPPARARSVDRAAAPSTRWRAPSRTWWCAARPPSARRRLRHGHRRARPGAARGRRAETLRATRPTAVNLFWAIERMLQPTPKNVPVRPSCGDLHRDARARHLHTMDVADVPQDRRATARRSSRRAACSPTATPARWRPAATAPRSASSAPRTSRSAASTSSPTRRARFCRARASPRGSCASSGIDVTLITDNMAAHVMQRGRDPVGHRRRRPHRRQRRHRQQDRHLRPSRCWRARTTSRSTSPRRCRRSIWRRRRRARSRSRSATRARSRTSASKRAGARRHQGAQPRLRRHAGRAHHRHHHQRRRRRGALRAVARGSGGEIAVSRYD